MLGSVGRTSAHPVWFATPRFPFAVLGTPASMTIDRESVAQSSSLRTPALAQSILAVLPPSPPAITGLRRERPRHAAWPSARLKRIVALVRVSAGEQRTNMDGASLA